MTDLVGCRVLAVMFVWWLRAVTLTVSFFTSSTVLSRSRGTVSFILPA